MATDEKYNCEQAIELTEWLQGILVNTEGINPAEAVKNIRYLAEQALEKAGSPPQPLPAWMSVRGDEEQ